MAGIRRESGMSVALLTGGDDRPYALGMASALAEQGIAVDFIGSDKLDAPQLHESPLITFLNLRGDQREDAPLRTKALRILAYYLRLGEYAFRSRPRIFHILWNNKFEWFDRTVLMLYYRLFGKRVVFTAHNVNTRKRDGCDSWLNRFTLRIQYRLCRHILVHTDAMKRELSTDFGIAPERVSVIPFGINDTNPRTGLGREEAGERLGLRPGDKALLFFGQIAPYKGLNYLVDAFADLAMRDKSYRLVIAGKVKRGYADYWKKVKNAISSRGLLDRIVERIEHIPDEEVELYFKAADVLIVPYTRVFQSGVPFLAYSFGLPVIATDTGSLREDIVEGETGFICQPRDATDLARAVGQYFSSELFRDLERRREEIKRYANERYSWAKVAEITRKVYEKLNAQEGR
jgi:D-inositol-3-phosphate glycosyltransferase